MPSISVRVPTHAVIEKLQQRLAEIDAAEAKNDEIVKQNEKAQDEYEIALLKLVLGREVHRVSQNSWRFGKGEAEVEVSYRVKFDELPPEPESIPLELVPKHAEEIRSAISLLQMTEEKTVTAATFKQISKYL